MRPDRFLSLLDPRPAYYEVLAQMALARDEFFPLTTGFQIVLWIQALIYGLGGLKEMCDDFLPSPKWRLKFVEANGWAIILHITGTKMHAAVLVILGYIAVNSFIEGGVTRSEFELFLLLSALMMATIWMTMVPAPMYFVVVMTKPVFFFLIVLSIGFWDLARPQVLIIAAMFNVYGIIVRAFGPVAYEPFTYEKLRVDIASEAESMAEKLDKLAVITGNLQKEEAASTEAAQPLNSTEKKAQWTLLRNHCTI